MGNLGEAISAANETFVRTFGEGDAAGLAARYTVEGWLLPPNAEMMIGREAIQAFWQAVMDAGLEEGELETAEAMLCGDMAIEVGNYKLFVADHQLADHGKYIVIWRQEDGQWKMHRDIFNSSMPAAGA